MPGLEAPNDRGSYLEIYLGPVGATFISTAGFPVEVS